VAVDPILAIDGAPTGTAHPPLQSISIPCSFNVDIADQHAQPATVLGREGGGKGESLAVMDPHNTGFLFGPL
jgi:hypothetical protein